MSPRSQVSYFAAGANKGEPPFRLALFSTVLIVNYLFRSRY